MNNIDHLLNDGEKLFRIERFQISRNDARIFIDILELLNEPQNKKFFARPNISIQYAEEQFSGKGDSPESALKDCLLKIKDYSIDIILPPLITD